MHKGKKYISNLTSHLISDDFLDFPTNFLCLHDLNYLLTYPEASKLKLFVLDGLDPKDEKDYTYP